MKHSIQSEAKALQSPRDGRSEVPFLSSGRKARIHSTSTSLPPLPLGQNKPLPPSQPTGSLLPAPHHVPAQPPVTTAMATLLFSQGLKFPTQPSCKYLGPSWGFQSLIFTFPLREPLAFSKLYSNRWTPQKKGKNEASSLSVAVVLGPSSPSASTPVSRQGYSACLHCLGLPHLSKFTASTKFRALCESWQELSHFSHHSYP